MAGALDLVKPSTDLNQSRRDLDERGYCIIPSVLGRNQIDALKARLTEQARGEDARGVATHDGGPSRPNQRVWMLLNKGRVFRDLMLHPIIAETMGHLLGADFLLSSFTANIARPGGEPMALHTDQGYVGFWTPKPVVANIAWMLDDFTDANGATRLVPASHLNAEATPRSSSYVPDQPANMPTHEDTIGAEGPAGSILCFDGRIWHGTGANRSDGPRHALLSYHCRPFIRQQENFVLGLDPAIRDAERPALLNRLGFGVWAGLGRVESPRPLTPLFVTPGAVGALGADGAPLEPLS